MDAAGAVARSMQERAEASLDAAAAAMAAHSRSPTAKASVAEEQSARATAEEDPEARAFREWRRQGTQIDEALAQRICEMSLADLARLSPVPDRDRSLATWMVWMVHRVSVNDPSLTSLDFGNLAMPAPRDEPRIVPKLMGALASNTHLVDLSLYCANFHGGEEAIQLSQSLAKNQTLKQLNVECNWLAPVDLEHIFASLRNNTTLRELRCSDQFTTEQAGKTVFAAAHEALQTNRTLQKLGMHLHDRHYNDQITKALIRNTEAARIDKRRPPQGGA